MSKTKNTQLIKRKKVTGTPFEIISNTENGEHFGIMGEHRITEIKSKPIEVKEELEKMSWDRIIQVIMIVTDKLKDINNAK